MLPASNTKVPLKSQTYDTPMETQASAPTEQNADATPLSNVTTMHSATELRSKQMPSPLETLKNPIRTHSDEDYGRHDTVTPETVVLRTKSYSTISSTPTVGVRRRVSGGASSFRKPYMDRSFSVPMEEKSDGTTSGINQIAAIRSFLESDYIPDEYWHLQRDSFIHRSYNEKLVARKNFQDQFPTSVSKKKPRPVSVPPPRPHYIETVAAPAETPMQRYSFIRQSLNTIRRSFSVKSGKHKGLSAASKKVKMHSNDSEVDSGNNNSDNMSETIASGIGELLSVPLENIRNGHSRNSSTSSCASNRSTSSVTLGLRSAPSTPMAPLQGQTNHDTQNAANVTNLLRSPSHSSTKIDARSNKHLSTSAPTPATVATSTTATPSPSPHPTKSSKHDAPEKEKKRKEQNSGRQKKFHRHFQQVAADERVINYFSCALVSDILLQGHLYITDNYFAFYSNVFGFVTKLLIPIESVVKISKEKTAKIIPNAVGVATADERHVFGSFMSREAAYQLMLSVWRPVAAVEPTAEIIPKMQRTDVEISENSIEEDSSSAISGNESPPRGTLMDSTTSTDASNTVRHRLSGICQTAAVASGPVNSLPPRDVANGDAKSPYDAVDGQSSTVRQKLSSSAFPSRSTSPAPRIVSVSRFYHLQFPDRYIHIGICLSILLAILSMFLFYRIINFQGRGSSHFNSSPIDIKWSAATKDMDVYAEVLRWQKEMQTKGADEAQIILNSNLEQIARVRKSLETLSILIHDKASSQSLSEHTVLASEAESYARDKDSPLDVGSIGQQ